MTQSRQSGSQDSYLECWVRNILFGIMLLVATKAVGPGLDEENISLKTKPTQRMEEPRELER